MKATGIIRRIDELGRIVIPKEIRRSQGLKEGDPLEIFLAEESGIVFRKYEIETYNSQFTAIVNSIANDYELTEDEKLVFQQMSALISRIEAQGN